MNIITAVIEKKKPNLFCGNNYYIDAINIFYFNKIVMNQIKFAFMKKESILIYQCE